VSFRVDIEKRLGDFSLAVRFEIGGGLTALFGPSGAGKTSVLNAIAGLLKPDRGLIEVGARTLFDSARGIDLAPEARRIGYVFQDGRLFPHLSVQRNLLYGFNRRPRLERWIELAPVVELLDIGRLLKRKPGTLSGGEQQRVAIGRALLAQPQALLMDEPFASLDQARRQEILPYVERLRDHFAIPILYVSHDLAEVTHLAHTIVHMSEGRVSTIDVADSMLPVKQPD
jgi:molybdate transport system ATP-binding protein